MQVETEMAKVTIREPLSDQTLCSRLEINLVGQPKILPRSKVSQNVVRKKETSELVLSS